MTFLDIFRLKFEKTIVIFKISILELVRIEFLGNTIDFGIAPVFSKGPDPGQGKSPLYKLCQLE